MIEQVDYATEEEYEDAVQTEGFIEQQWFDKAMADSQPLPTNQPLEDDMSTEMLARVSDKGGE